MPTVVLDVGANAGEFSIEVARRGASRVIAIEPVPQLVAKIREVAEQEQLPIEVFELAVAASSGTRKFNVAKHADWGVSGLNRFNPLIKVDEYWSQRPDLYFDEEITVRTTTMQEFVATAGLIQIDFIKIDVQGSDLEVLQSFGPKISLIKAGVMEVCSTATTALYTGCNNTLHNALNFLSDNNFQEYLLKQNDPACNEMNVYFSRRDVDYIEIETELKLKGIDLYDGRHYWFLPSAKAKEPEIVSLTKYNEMHAEATRTHAESTRMHEEVDRLNREICQLQEILEACRQDRV